MHNRVKQRGLALLVTVGLLATPLAFPLAAAASPHDPHHASSHGHALVDRNGDHLSDGLDAKLSEAKSTARLDVVATFANRGSMRGARRALGHVDTTFSLIPGFVARLTPGQVRSMAHRSGVVRVEQDFAIHALDDVANRDFGVAAAQNTFSATGTGTEVCVVDTGVDPNHGQLDSKGPIPWMDYINGRPTPYDDQGHGTHVASIAVGDGVGSGSIAQLMIGVAPEAHLSAAKVLDSTGSGDDSLGILGIQWCAGRASVDVISLSLGSDVPSDGLDGLSRAVDAAVLNHSKIVVAAAGNGGDLPGTITSPGSAAQAITVGAAADWSTTVPQYGAQGPFLAWFSSRGPTLDNRTKPDIVAPGVGVRSSYPRNTYAILSGTSMATPHIAGVIALIDEAKPQLIGDVDGTEALIETTAKHVDSSTCSSRGSYPNNLYGWGFVNASAAVKPSG